MSLLDSVNQLSDYLDNAIKSGNKTFEASTTRASAQPDGQLQQQLQTQTSQTAMDAIAQNPVANTAIDTVNTAITSVSQQLVKNVITKVNLTPIQNATKQFFSMYATVTSFGTEVAMAFARNTGGKLVAAVKNKDSISQQLEAEIVALYNACAILLGGQPFFDQYLRNVAQAYTLILQADTNLKTVVQALESPNPFYQATRFNLSISQLTQAENLILPDRGVDVSSIRGTKNFVSSVVKSQSNKQVYAAAVSIPGITAKIGKLVLDYELQSINVNAYINTFVRALSDYISNYTQSNSVNQATIDHINAGTSQIDNLLAQMNTILSQNTGSSTDVTFRAKLSSYGTLWGAELAAIIAWLEANPGAGSALLTQTSASVLAYNKAVAGIESINSIPFTNGEVIINQGQENALQGLVVPLTRLLVTANTLVATSTSRNDVREQSLVIRTYLQKARQADAAIIAAVQPFLNTQTTLTGKVNKLVQQLVGFASKAGLDRIVGLLTNGKVADLFSATPDTSTFAGAAVNGINDILTSLKEIPGATTQQISQLETLRDQVLREQKAQEVYAGRSASLTEGDDIAQQQANVENDKTLVRTATETAKQLDSSLDSDPAEETQKLLTPQLTPGTLPDSSDAKAGLI